MEYHAAYLQPPNAPNPLSRQEQRELEDCQRVISSRGADTPVEIFRRFGELRKKHADWFLARRKARADHWKEEITLDE